MKILDLIKILEEFNEKHGNLPVFIKEDNWNGNKTSMIGKIKFETEQLFSDAMELQDVDVNIIRDFFPSFVEFDHEKDEEHQNEFHRQESTIPIISISIGSTILNK
jgi:hypothetical protein